MSLPLALPEKFDPSVPLSDPRYERFAQLRVIGVPKIAAAWEAGFRKEGTENKPILPGNAARLDRHPEVVARKIYLSKDDVDAVAGARLAVFERLMASLSFDILKDYSTIKTVEIDGKKVQQVVIDWRRLKNSEHSSLITKLKFDPVTGNVIDFERDDPQVSMSQIRDMQGWRAPRRKELSGPNGGAIQTEDVSQYTDDELASLKAIQLAANARRSVAHTNPGGD